MPNPSRESIRTDPWAGLREHTSARIALGRAGDSLPTRPWLEFKAAHAAARDAVWDELDSGALACKLGAHGDAIIVQSQVDDKATYLRRPDLGRRLCESSRVQLTQAHHSGALAIIVSDGLSARAAHTHAPPLLDCLLPLLGPVLGGKPPALVVASYARVALEDEIGLLLKARIALILLGERPGLGSPDSLGAYFVHDPRPGKTDADRNCVSNIRPQGLGYAAAAATLHYLLARALSEGISGVGLKDERPLHPESLMAAASRIGVPPEKTLR